MIALIGVEAAPYYDCKIWFHLIFDVHIHILYVCECVIILNECVSVVCVNMMPGYSNENKERGK